MFSGLVQEVGQLESSRGRNLSVLSGFKKDRKGDSVAVNGVCLTVVTKSTSGRKVRLRFELTPETLKRTTLGNLKAGEPVNLERALTLKDTLGGHLVQGHVDEVGRVRRIVSHGKSREMSIKAPASVMEHLVPQGSITVDGVSLTVTRAGHSEFSVSLIPFTLKHTTLRQKSVGDIVNLEADLIAKYVAKYAGKRK